MSRDLNVFGTSLGKVKKNDAKFHHYAICETDFLKVEVGAFRGPPFVSSPKKGHPE